MAQAGVLGETARLNEAKDAWVIDLGYSFGDYESWLRNEDITPAEIEQKCNKISEDINCDLEENEIRFRLDKYSNQSKRKVKGARNKIIQSLANMSDSYGIYFLIGTAAGILLHSRSEDQSMDRIDQINLHFKTMNVDTEALHQVIKSTIVPLDGKSPEMALTRLKTKLQELKEPKTILFVTADPSDESRTQSNKEFRDLEETLRTTHLKKAYRIQPQLSCRPQDLERSIMDYRPHIIHFAGHGDATGLCFQDDENHSHLVSKESLANLFSLAKAEGLCLVFLNACYTSEQSESIAQSVGLLIGMEGAVSDKNAINFSTSFYGALGRGKSIHVSFRQALYGSSLSCRPDGLKPQLIEGNQRAMLKLEISDEETQNLVRNPSPDSAAAKSIADLDVDADDRTDKAIIDDSINDNVSIEMPPSPDPASESKEGEKSARTAQVSSSESCQDGVVDVSDELHKLHASAESNAKPGQLKDDQDQNERGVDSEQADLHTKPGPASSASSSKPTSPQPSRPSESDPPASGSSTEITPAQNSTPKNVAVATTPGGDSFQPEKPRQDSQSSEPSARQVEGVDLVELESLRSRPDFQQFRSFLIKSPNMMPQIIEHYQKVKPQLWEKISKFDSDVIVELLDTNSVQNIGRTKSGPSAMPVAPQRQRQSPAPLVRQQRLQVPAPRMPTPFEMFNDSIFGSLFGQPMMGIQHLATSPSGHPYANVRCDRCHEPFPRQGGYRCRVCRDGKYDVCAQCIHAGIGCLNRNHSLIKLSPPRA